MDTAIKRTAVAICGLALTACGGGDDGNQGAYTVTPSVNGSGGAISPATPVSVKSGATTAFTPSSGLYRSFGWRHAQRYDLYHQGRYRQLYRGGGIYCRKPPAHVQLSRDINCRLLHRNGRGQAGYWLYPDTPAAGPAGNLYVKNNASNATYAYDVPMQPTTAVNDYLAQLNSEGANGYLALVPDMEPFSRAREITVYVKDQTQSAAFTYQSPDDNGSAQTLDQMNSYGAQSYAYWGFFQLGTVGPIRSYYVKASHCSGWMCTAPDHIVYVVYVTTGPPIYSVVPVQSN
jgi:hypothetical protein